jgi:hypothetical protein
MGTLHSADRGSLAVLCESWEEAICLTRKCKRLGVPKAIALGIHKAKNAALLRYSRCCGEFGMTPASRSKVSAEPVVPRQPSKERFFHGA